MVHICLFVFHSSTKLAPFVMSISWTMWLMHSHPALPSPYYCCLNDFIAFLLVHYWYINKEKCRNFQNKSRYVRSNRPDMISHTLKATTCGHVTRLTGQDENLSISRGRNIFLPSFVGPANTCHSQLTNNGI